MAGFVQIPIIKPAIKALVTSLEKTRESNQKYAQIVQTQITFTVAMFITAEPKPKTFNPLVRIFWLGLLVQTKQPDSSPLERRCLRLLVSELWSVFYVVSCVGGRRKSMVWRSK